MIHVRLNAKESICIHVGGWVTHPQCCKVLFLGDVPLEGTSPLEGDVPLEARSASTENVFTGLFVQ